MGFIQYIWDKGLVIPDLVKFLGPFGRHVTHSILSKRIGFTAETSDFRTTNVDLLNEYCYQVCFCFLCFCFLVQTIEKHTSDVSTLYMFFVELGQ